MPTWTDPADQTTATLIDATLWNQLFGTSGSLAAVAATKRPRCLAYHNTTQSINNATDTALLFNSEDRDVGTMHDTASNTSRFTVPSGWAGDYMGSGKVFFTSNSAGIRYAWWRKNGTTELGGRVVFDGDAGDGNSLEVAVPFFAPSLVAGDYLEFIVHQTSGGALSTGNATRQISNQAFVYHYGM